MAEIGDAVSAFQGGKMFDTKLLAVAVVAMAVGSSAPAQTAATPTPAPVAQKRICRSSLETGSLVKKHKVCLTSDQWRYVTDKSSDDARRIVDDNAGRPSCNGLSSC